MGPLLALGLVGGAVGAGYLFVKGATPAAAVGPQLANASGSAIPLAGVMPALVQGQTYNVMLSVNTSADPNKGMQATSLDDGVKQITTAYQFLGFSLVAPPAPATDADKQNFLAHGFSTWTFTGVWTKAANMISAIPAWVGIQGWAMVPVAAVATPASTPLLQKGMTYAVLLTITAQDGRAGQVAIGTTDAGKAASSINDAFTFLGWKVLSAPVPRNGDEAMDFANKNPSSWLLTAQWTKDTAGPEQVPAWVLSQSWTVLPVS